jgi:hypothetical protein
MKKTTAFFLTIFFVSCVSEKKQEINIEILPNNTTLMSIEEHVAYIEIIPLETVMASLLRGIKSVKFVDNFIFVEDIEGGRTYAFDRTGKFISKIGNEGQGPSDYTTNIAFFIDEENRQVVLIDNMRGALIKHDFYGRFQGLQRIEQRAVSFTNQALLNSDNNSLFLNHLINHRDNIAYTVLSGYDFHHIERFFPYNPIAAENYGVGFSNHPMTRTSDGSVNLIMPLNDTIYNFHNGTITPKYRVEFPEKRMRMAPKDRFKTTIENSFFRMMIEYGRQGYFTGFTGIFETENKILLNYRHKGIFMGYYLYDKISEQGGYEQYTIEAGLFPFWMIISSHDNFLVSAMDAESLFALKDSMEDLDKSDSNNARLFEVVDNLQYDDNPVLLLYHMK